MDKVVNRVELEGTLAWNPDFAYLPNGTAKVRTKLLVPAGQRRRYAIPIVVWGDLAEAFQNCGFSKGDTLRVTGYYTVRRWKPANDDRYREDHYVTVTAWQKVETESQSMGTEVVEDDDAPF